MADDSVDPTDLVAPETGMAPEPAQVMRGTAEFDITGPLPEGTVVLEASAGTGKTYTIAALATRFIAEGRFSLDELMMVTFSRAATRELKARVLARIRESSRALVAWQSAGVEPTDVVDQLLCRGDGAEVAERIERLSQALAEADSATIATTHEFCSRMLSELGLLVDHDSTSVFVDDLTELQRQVIHDVYLAQFPEVGPRVDEVEKLCLAVLRRSDLDLAAPDDNPRSQTQHRLAVAVRREFDRRKRDLGVYTFDDMVSRLRAALAHPVTGTQAAELLASRFPLVLIDEFQDTDLAQWDIVSRAFVGRSTVVLIGDPKQAIYAFRDADVLAYLNAVTSADAVFTLATNHRSDPGVVTGIGQLFGGAALGDPRITVHPVRAATHAPRLRRVESHHSHRRPGSQSTDSVEQAPGVSHVAGVELRCLPSVPGKPVSAVWRTREVVDQDLASVVLDLLDGSWQVFDPAAERWRQLAASDIAVLVRSNWRGRSLQRVLSAVGVDAVSSGADTVFASQAAHDWRATLAALIEPSAARLAQAAMSSLFGWSFDQYAEAAAGTGERSLDQLAVEIRTLQRLMRDDGISAVFASLLDRGDLAARLLATPGGERTFTDVRHIAELLNDAQVRDHRSVGSLLRWLDERIAEASIGADGDRTRRLETDREAVRIMTIHRAKGLEFPIVLVPEGADLRPQRTSEVPAVVAFEHVDQAQHTQRLLDVSVGNLHRKRAHQAAIEARDEELRTLYVACTRARSRLVCWWAASESYTEYSPLHRIVCGSYSAGHTPPAAVSPDLTPFTAAFADPSRFSGGDLSVVPVLPDPLVPEEHKPSVVPLLSARRFSRAIDTRWRRTSYSGLTAEAHGVVVADAAGSADRPDDPSLSQAAPQLDDEPVLAEAHLLGALPDSELVEAAGAGQPTLPRRRHQVPVEPDSALANLPGGTDFGTLVHAVLEHVTTDADDLALNVKSATAEWLDQFPLPGVSGEALTTGLTQVLSTPLTGLLDTATESLSLAQVRDADRLSEFDFELSMSQLSSAAHTLADLAEALGDPTLTGSDQFAAAYAEHLRLSPVADKTLAGFLTGSIDAVVRQHTTDQSRFHVIDYKTNRLLLPPGEQLTAGHYLREPMAEAMIAAHYPLQALLYCVAVHRHLRWRMTGYQPTSHLGGVGYLFVRGMAGPSTPVVDGTRCGVFTWWPSPGLVTRASQILGGAA